MLVYYVFFVLFGLCVGSFANVLIARIPKGLSIFYPASNCPNCHKKMELIKKGEEETFVCQCGYKEKLSAFKARREKEGAGVSKKDVQKYLKKQKDEPINNAFAEALRKIGDGGK